MRWRWVIIMSVLFFFEASEIQAQKKLDSLLTVLNYYKNEDIIKLKLLIRISEQYQNVDPNEGVRKGLQCAELAKKIKQDSLLCECLESIGDNYEYTNKLDSSLFYYSQEIAIAKRDKNKKLLARALNNSASAKKYLRKFKEALEDYNLSIELLKEMKEERKTQYPLLNIATIYKAIYNYPQALLFSQKALDISSRAGDKYMIAGAYNEMASSYKNMEQYENALLYYRKALKEAEPLHNKDQVASLNARIGSTFSDLQLFDSAELYIKRGLAIAKETNHARTENIFRSDLVENYILQNKYEDALLELKTLNRFYESKNDSFGLCVVNIEMGKLFTLCSDEILLKENIPVKARHQTAMEYLNRGKDLATAINQLDMLKNAYENITTANEKQSDYVAALESYKKYISTRDTILNDKKKGEFRSIEMQYAFDKKEDSLKLIQANTEATLSNQQFLNKQQSQNLLLSQQQLALTNKEKDLQHLAFLKTQADLQTEQLQKSEKEKQLIIAQKEQQLQSAQVISLSQENDLNKLKQRQLLFYSIAGLAALLFGSLYFFNRNRAKQAQLKVELEKKEAEFQRSLADVSMSALRSQMNPHFIFNCLNSIKLYTTQNDSVAASAYLTKFSKLIRMALENSRNETVTLKAELESLDLYIQMEAMRFKDKLKYTITVDENVDSSFIEIPPLLLQPYVENAIWHGLMHKEDGGRIAVQVRELPNEPVLSITIQDNGVGRLKSAELQSKSATKHKSYGTKVTSERLDLINKVYKTGASVTTEDVLNESGAIAGTLVTIKIPFE